MRRPRQGSLHQRPAGRRQAGVLAGGGGGVVRQDDQSDAGDEADRRRRPGVQQGDGGRAQVSAARVLRGRHDGAGVQCEWDFPCPCVNRRVNPLRWSPQGPVIIASSQGGVNIEEVAAENPDAIIYEPIDIVAGLQPEQAKKIAKKLGLENIEAKVVKLLTDMYELFIKKDALLIEINPYAEDAFDNDKCKC